MAHLKFFMTHNLFTFDEVYAQQRDGVAVGLASSPPVMMVWWVKEEKGFLRQPGPHQFGNATINIMPANFPSPQRPPPHQINMVTMQPTVPKMFKAYVDDCAGLWQGPREAFNMFVGRMDAQNPKLKYTGEDGDRITMLDTVVYIENGRLEVTMYEKPLSNPQALAYNSCHPNTC